MPIRKRRVPKRGPPLFIKVYSNISAGGRNFRQQALFGAQATWMLPVLHEPGCPGPNCCVSLLCGQICVVFGLFLLIHPDLHHQLVGQQLDKTDLIADRQPVNGNIFSGAVQIPQAGSYHILCFVQVVKILDLVGIGLHGVVKELSLDPAGVHGHHADAFAF